MKTMIDRADGNPLLKAKFGGTANEYASAAGKGDLFGYVNNAFVQYDKAGQKYSWPERFLEAA